MDDLKEKLLSIKEQLDEAIASCDSEYEEDEEMEEDSDEDEGKSGSQESGKKESVGKIIALMTKK